MTTAKYSPEEWVQLKTNLGSQTARWNMLRVLALSQGDTGLTVNDHERMNKFGIQLRDRILSGAEDPYRFANSVMTWMRGQHYSSCWTANVALLLRLYLKINRADIVDEEWDAKVQVPVPVREKEKGTLTLEGVKLLVQDSNLEYQTLYEVMAIGGARIHEALLIRMKDIRFKEGLGDIPIVLLRATKTGTAREFPLSQECYGLIQKLQRHKGDWPLFERLSLLKTGPQCAYWHSHDQMVKYGLTKKVEWLRGGGEAWTVTLHNFRQFAENNIVKHWGDFEAPDVAKWLVGRKASVGSRGAYQTIEDIAPRWKEWIEPHTRFL